MSRKQPATCSNLRHTTLHALVLSSACLALWPSVAAAKAIPVELRQTEQGWQLLREEVIDVPARLNVGIANDLVVDLRDERRDAPHTLGPTFGIEILRSPGVHLLLRVVGASDLVDCGVEDRVQGGLIANCEVTDVHNSMGRKKGAFGTIPGGREQQLPGWPIAA